eukprot:1159167-Pelagomonas_calceolata.AAC.1
MSTSSACVRAGSTSKISTVAHDKRRAALRHHEPYKCPGRVSKFNKHRVKHSGSVSKHLWEARCVQGFCECVQHASKYPRAIAEEALPPRTHPQSILSSARFRLPRPLRRTRWHAVKGHAVLGFIHADASIASHTHIGPRLDAHRIPYPHWPSSGGTTSSVLHLLNRGHSSQQEVLSGTLAVAAAAAAAA